jgi:hypothetical protein
LTFQLKYMYFVLLLFKSIKQINQIWFFVMTATTSVFSISCFLWLWTLRGNPYTIFIILSNSVFVHINKMYCSYFANGLALCHIPKCWDFELNLNISSISSFWIKYFICIIPAKLLNYIIYESLNRNFLKWKWESFQIWSDIDVKTLSMFLIAFWHKFEKKTFIEFHISSNWKNSKKNK